MPNDDPPRLGLTLPPRVVADTRAECRDLVVAHVDEAARVASGDGAPPDARAVTLDLSDTHEVDASGLGILVLAHKRARAHGLTVRLWRAPEPVRRLLILTKLDYLFEFAE